MKYPWKRFWCPRDGVINLSDDGFLYDPESEYGKYVNPDIVPFEKISHIPYLALLGEPGIGKSTAMEKLQDALRESIPVDQALLCINLNEYGNESRLIQNLFESNEFRTWTSGNRTMHVEINRVMD